MTNNIQNSLGRATFDLAVATLPEVRQGDDICTAFEIVQHLVCAGKLRIIHIDAPPRTISSAFQIALTEGGDGHLYEPFRRNSSKKGKVLEATCQDVVDLYNKILSSPGRDSYTNKPIVLTVKELSQYIKNEDFKRWLPLIGGWVSMVRTPNTQMQSFMTRSILNGSHFSPDQVAETKQTLVVKNGYDPTDYQVVEALSEGFTVKRGKRTPADVRLPHKLGTPQFDMWGALSRHYAAVQSCNIPTVVVDGTIVPDSL